MRRETFLAVLLAMNSIAVTAAEQGNEPSPSPAQPQTQTQTQTQVKLVPAQTVGASPFPGANPTTALPPAPGNLTPEQLQTRSQLANQVPSDSDNNATNYGPQSSATTNQGDMPTQDSVYETTKQMLAPVSPQQLRELKEEQDHLSRANSYNPVSFIPRTSSLSLDLSPGAAIPVVRVAPGKGTFITFDDMTGQPWPLASTPLNSDAGYSVTWFENTHTVYVQPLKAYGNGDLGVMLTNLPTPISIVLANGEPDSDKKARVYDQRISMRLPLRGPNAKQYSVTQVNKIGLYDEELQALLDGVPPKDAKKLKTDNPLVSVWKLAGKMYVRTTLNSKSIFSKTLSSSDGTHVYEMELTPFVTMSDGMSTITVRVEL